MFDDFKFRMLFENNWFNCNTVLEYYVYVVNVVTN